MKNWKNGKENRKMSQKEKLENKKKRIKIDAKYWEKS